MKDRELIILFVSISLILLMALGMGFLHEKHYRNRRTIIDPTRPIEERITVIESILMEDRLT